METDSFRFALPVEIDPPLPDTSYGADRREAMRRLQNVRRRRRLRVLLRLRAALLGPRRGRTRRTRPALQDAVFSAARIAASPSR